MKNQRQRQKQAKAARKAYKSKRARLKTFSRMMRRNLTGPEYSLWQIIRGWPKPFNCLPQFIICNAYIADFAFPRRRLVVEVDDPGHERPSRRWYDQKRTDAMERDGWRVIRFTNAEVTADEFAVGRRIVEALGSTQLVCPCAYLSDGE